MRRRHSNRGASHPLLLLQSVSLITVISLVLGGCELMGLSEPSVPGLSSVTSMFDKKQEKLPGRRISVLKADEKGSVSAPEAPGPITLPPAVMNASWSQPGGVPTNAPGHLAIGDALHTVWTANAGEGSSKRERLTAIPIVYDKKIFTMDAEGRSARFPRRTGAFSGASAPSQTQSRVSTICILSTRITSRARASAAGSRLTRARFSSRRDTAR